MMSKNLEIRYHFPREVELEADEPVVLERRLIGTSEFIRYGVAPNSARDMKSIRVILRDVALRHGGEAWRAITQRGEILCVFSAFDLAKELNHKRSHFPPPRSVLS